MGARITARLRLKGSITQSWYAQRGSQGTQNLLHFSFFTFPIVAAAHCSVSPHRLGIAFAYYGVILASAELLERDLVCGSAAPPVQDPGDDSEESRSPCHCRLFGPAAYQTMITSTVGEIARNLFSPPLPALPFPFYSQPIFAAKLLALHAFSDVPEVEMSSASLASARHRLFK